MKIKKLLVLLLLTFVFCVAGNVSAMTEAEKQALIAQIQQQIAALQQELAQMIAEQQGTATWCHTFNTTLGYVDSGTNEVVNLHLALQQEGISYSPDNITTYSTGTSEAIKIFQAKYGISPLSGFTGVKTKAKLNQLYGCESTTPINCTTNWSCTTWSSCNTNGQQTRTCTDYNYCGILSDQPITTQYCNSSCTPNWQTGSWGGCSNGQQTRTVTDSNYCGTTTGKPATTQSCNASCTPDWDCTDWGICVNSQQTKTCTDTNNCGVDTGKPSLSQSCTVEPDVSIQANESNGPVNIFLMLGSGAAIHNSGFTLTKDITLKWTGVDVSSCVASDSSDPAIFSGYQPSSGSQIVTLSGDIDPTSSYDNKVTATFDIDCVSTKTGYGISDSVTVNLFYTTTSSCTPSWSCDNWNTCTYNSQTRTCTDSNGCGSLVGRPSLTQSCVPNCVPNWQVGTWGSCTNGQQTRTVTDSNYCGTTTGQPVTTQSCTATCTPDWQCASWGNCTNSLQTRTCSDSNYCGITTGKPAESQSCTPACDPDWSCGSWGLCIGSQQTRTCADSNSCGVTTNKPVESQSCTQVSDVLIRADGSEGPLNVFLTLGNGAAIHNSGFTLTKNITIQWTGVDVSSCVASDTLSPTIFSGYKLSSNSEVVTLSGDIDPTSSYDNKVTNTFRIDCVSTKTGYTISDNVTVNLFYTASSTCNPNWSCTAWNTCTYNSQTRTCTDSNGCGSLVGKPATTQSCAPCTPNWTCGLWNDCVGGNQTRICTDSNSCGVTTNKPSESQTCTSCTPNWSCGLWGSCTNSQQTRICTDSNSCGTNTNKPVTTQSCTLTPTVDIRANNSDGPIIIATNSSAVLTWSSSNVASCTASGSWGGSKSTSGNMSSPLITSSSTFTITCTGSNGTASDSVIVNSTGTISVDIKANNSDGPINVDNNTVTNLSWTSLNASSCTASGNWSGSKTAANSEALPTHQNASGTIATKTYTITCTNAAGSSATDTVTVNVSATPYVPTVTLKINDTYNSATPFVVIQTGTASQFSSQFTLSWVSTSSTSCTASGAWSGAKDLVAYENKTVTIGSGDAVQDYDKRFTITCTGPGGSATNHVDLYMLAAIYSANVTPYYINGTTRYGWMVNWHSWGNYPVRVSLTNSTGVERTACSGIANQGQTSSINGCIIYTGFTAGTYTIKFYFSNTNTLIYGGQVHLSQ